METSIEITNNGKVYCKWVKDDAVRKKLYIWDQRDVEQVFTLYLREI